MKQLFLLLLLISFSCTFQKLSAQVPGWQWVKSAGGGSSDVTNGIATDANGNSFITGYFYSPTITFGSTTLTNSGLSGTHDFFLVKYDPLGNVLWARSAIGASYDRGMGITTDPSGNVLVAGYFSGPSITFGTTTLSCSGNTNVFVAKYDSSGNLIWAKRAGGTGSSQAYAISSDVNGNVFLTGSFLNSSITFGTITLTNVGNQDIFVAKYDASGNVVWARSAGGNSLDNGFGISNDASGNTYVTGQYASPVINFGTATLTNTSSDFDFFIVKYNGSGNIVWAKSAGGAAQEKGVSISCDALGNSFVTGQFSSPSITFGTSTLINGGGSVFDIFVVKYNSSGNVLWAKSGSGSAADYVWDNAIDTSGNSFITGLFDSPSITFGTTTLIRSSVRDIFVVKYDIAGNVLWAKSTTGNSFIEGYGISWDENGSVLVTGALRGFANFDTILLTTPSTTTDDVYVAKICELAKPDIFSSGATTFCRGDSVILTASSANSYLWSNGATTQSITVMNSGSYSVRITNLYGCNATSAVTNVAVDTLLSTTVTPGAATTFCQGSSVALTSSAASSYLWSNNVTTQSITVSASGAYFVIAANSCGSDTSSYVNIVVNPLPLALVTANGTTTFCEGDSVTLTAALANSYLWSNGDTTQNTPALSTGNYYVTVTGANGCSATSTSLPVTVNPLPHPTITASGSTEFCQGDSVILTAPGGMSNYYWSNTATSQSIAVSNTENISVTVTDPNGCAATTLPLQIRENPWPNPVITAGSATAFCQGAAVMLAASTGMTTYNWSTGTTSQNILVSNTGNYSVTVIDSNGCSATSPALPVTVYPLPSSMVNQTGATSFCRGDSVMLTAANGGISYNWSNGANSQSIIVSDTENDSVIVTDAHGCTATSAVIHITAYPLPSAVISPGGPTTFCQGDSVMLTAPGGGSAYNWSNGESSQSIFALNSENDSVTVIDSHGCSATSPALQVTVYPLPDALITATGPTSFCQGDSLTLMAPTGMSGYYWSNNSNLPFITVFSSQTDSVMVTDANGCSATSQALEVTVNSLPDANIAPESTTTFCEGGSVTLDAPAGMNSYLWSDGTSSQSITVSLSGSYYVIVNNSCGSDTSSITNVIVHPLPSAAITASGSALNSSSVTGNQWYLNGNIIPGATAQSLNLMQDGNYTVTVTDSNGCSASSDPITINTLEINEQLISTGPAISLQQFNSEISVKTTGINNLKCDLNIIDILGREVYNSPITNQMTVLNGNLQPGIYFLQLIFGNEIITKKVMVK
ncbi:MAG: hypothetical protein JWO09_1425 [Bacteroidetes bacterium]|nr:hypothetical protein [Bacteroidota bacterium]